MKQRIVLLNCCVVLSVLLTGCQFVSDNIGKEEKQNEIVTEIVTETGRVDLEVEVESEEVKQDNEAAVGLGTVQVVPVQETETELEIIQIYEEPAVVSYEEDYMQCPYCAHWFGTADDGNGSPYDKHIEEERAADSAHGLTEAELAECPDCGNWYPTGNIFRNHICEGRE